MAGSMQGAVLWTSATSTRCNVVYSLSDRDNGMLLGAFRPTAELCGDLQMFCVFNRSILIHCLGDGQMLGMHMKKQGLAKGTESRQHTGPL